MNARVLLSTVFLALAAAPLTAQDCDCEDWPDDTRYPTGGYVGGSFIYADPRGEFGRNINDALGGDVFYVHALDHDGVVGLRVGGGFLNYGYERQRVRISPTVGDRVLMDLITTNNIGYLGVGPQIGLPDGVLRPYAHGFVGVSYLVTSSSLRGSDSDYAFAESTNLDDFAFAYGAGGGLYIPLRHGASPVSLDLGATYHHGGESAYLSEGDIEDLPDGGIILHPHRSATDLVAFHIGVVVGISH